MAKVISEAVKQSEPVSLPHGLTEADKVELVKFLNTPVHAEWHGGDPRYNRRAIVRITSNYSTYAGRNDSSFLHSAAVNGRSHQFKVGKWCALPLAIIEAIARQTDDYEVTMISKPADNKGMEDFTEVSRSQFRMLPKFEVEEFGDTVADGMKWSPLKGFSKLEAA